tara:strand:+ start:1881 stop:2114 length:234 start_codon:yes stop_codon:yes gene_type:complete
MKMHKEEYKDLILRFSKELYDVGVTEDSKKNIEDQYNRSPNIISCNTEEVVKKFSYENNGYKIEAKQTVSIVVKKTA